MHLILLSGGSGQRLWPLSNDVRAKQFLKLLKAPDGGMESMVQRVYRQILEAGREGSWESITVAAGLAQADQLRAQLGDGVNIVLEPERRDTFPAIALACAYLHFEKGIARDGITAVLPVDPFVEAEYFGTVARIEPEIRDTDADLVLIGAKPVFPSEKYGYIVPEADAQAAPAGGPASERVARFKEKPGADEAAGLISQGAMWNCGVFGLRIGYIFDILEEKYGIAAGSFGEMIGLFPLLRKTSFDYEVVEKARNIRVLRYGGFWEDLGTWRTFTDEMSSPSYGNAVVDGSCSGTHVINELDTPVVAMGLDGLVVAAGYDGILVAAKSETYRLKEAISDIHGRVMFEERRWGSYKVLDHSRYGDTEVLTKKLTLLAGKQFSYQYHEHRKEIWNIITGEGTLYLEGVKSPVKKGDVVSIDVGVRHGLWAECDLELIEVQMGTPLVEEDIVRIEVDWER
jgi:mannose-1-phosphate guanylyltransferase